MFCEHFQERPGFEWNTKCLAIEQQKSLRKNKEKRLNINQSVEEMNLVEYCEGTRKLERNKK